GTDHSSHPASSARVVRATPLQDEVKLGEVPDPVYAVRPGHHFGETTEEFSGPVHAVRPRAADRGLARAVAGRGGRVRPRTADRGHPAGTKRTRNVFGHSFPVMKKASVPGMAAMPLSTSACARSCGFSRPDASISPVTTPASGSMRRIVSVCQTLA